MSLRTRQQVFALLTFSTFVVTGGGLTLVYVLYREALAEANAAAATSAGSAIGMAAGALTNAVATGAAVLAVGLAVTLLCGVVSWRANVRLHEDARHSEIVRALAALVRQGRA